MRLRRQERRRGLGLWLAAVALHGLWNASQIVIIKLTVDQAGNSDPFALIAAGNAAGWAVIAWNAGLTLVTAVLLITIPTRLAQATVQAQPRTSPPPYLAATTFPAR